MDHKPHMTPRPLPPFTALEERCLAANLGVLSKVDAQLATRLAWPCDTSRTFLDGKGRISLRMHRELHLLGISPPAPSTESSPQAVLLVGCGLGEGVSAWLRHSSTTEVHAYERDPWILRLCLARNDWTRELSERQLHLHLGIDLAEHRQSLAPLPREYHPLLGPVYAWEDRFLDTPAENTTLFVMPGALFVEDLAAELVDLSYAVLPFDGQAWSLEELDHALSIARPEAVLSINFVPGLDELLAGRDIPYRCWEIDPCLDPKQVLRRPKQAASKIATWCRRGKEEFRSMGFEDVEWLPLAARPATRQAPAMSQQERARYSAPLAFVGNSMQAEADAAGRRFLELWQIHAASTRQQMEEGMALLREAIEIQDRDFDKYLIPAYLETRAPEFLNSIRRLPGHEDPLTLLGEIAASRKRLTWIQSLAPMGVQVWGDEGWRAIEGQGIVYRGPAGHRQELNKIYASAQIQVDLGRIYQEDIVTMRVFDALACGAFVLAPWCEDLEELFDLPTELESYRSLAELREKSAWYLAHPERCRSIATKGREAVLARHRMDQRIACLLKGLAPAHAPTLLPLAEISEARVLGGRGFRANEPTR